MTPPVEQQVAIPIGQLAPGQAAHVSRVVGLADFVHRLEEFGLRRGIRVEMFRRGNPCILRLSGGKICLRSDEMLNVLVTPASAVG